MLNNSLIQISSLVVVRTKTFRYNFDENQITHRIIKFLNLVIS